MDEREKELEDFFKNKKTSSGNNKILNNDEPGKSKKSGLLRVKKEKRIQKSFKKWFQEFVKIITNKFSFEVGVDILDETSVLYRRNVVIKNILFVTNSIFIIFTLIGSKGTNIIIALIFFIIMYFINLALKRVINEEPRTLLKQQLAMYISSVYIIIMTIAVYVKLTVSVDLNNEYYFSITQASYSLIYFALVILALYQDSKLLKITFKWILILMTIIHITVLYPLYQVASTLKELFDYIFVLHPQIISDIILRTLVLVIIMIALYATTSISEKINRKRKEELLKRRNMEKDFKIVVSDVFDVIKVYNDKGDNMQQKVASLRIARMSQKLAQILNYSPKICKEIYDYSIVHYDKLEYLNISEFDDEEILDESDFKLIRDKTLIGSVIIKRLQLNKKAENIIRTHFEKNTSEEFIKEMNLIQNNRESQIILLSEMYEILRQDRSYKKQLNHQRTIELLKLEFVKYFDYDILERFIKYADEFERIYQGFY